MGASFTAGNHAVHAFLYTDGLGMIDLNDRIDPGEGGGASPPGGRDDGRVGRPTPAPPRSPAAARPKALLPRLPALGWTLVRATGINRRGQIIGFGLHQGQRRPFRLTPLR